ncbi:MAG: VOC family protein, partial [Roseiflexaceae bacterium]
DIIIIVRARRLDESTLRIVEPCSNATQHPRSGILYTLQSIIAPTELKVGGYIMRAHHIAIYTRDLARLAAFYTQTLGFAVVRRWDAAGIVFVDAGGLWVELTRQDAPNDGTQPRALDQGVGINHLALQVDNVNRAFQQLADQGVRVLAAPAVYENVRVAFLADPDGNVLELIEDSER